MIVRAQNEGKARFLAADALGEIPEPVLGLEAREPWTDGKIVTCERFAESGFEEDGPDTILGPEEALAKAHPS